MKSTRRENLKVITKGLVGAGIMGYTPSLIGCKSKNSAQEVQTEEKIKDMFFDISLAQWSLHKSFFGDSLSNGFGPFIQGLQNDPDSLLRGGLNPADFPLIAKREYGIDAVEYVNTFYFSKAKNMEFWKGMKEKCDSEGVKSVLIMCDALGDLGDTNDSKRAEAVTNHHPWVDIANYLGCHAIRVNAAGSGTAEEVKDAAVQGLGALTEYGSKNGISIIVENHGGYSSNGAWLADVMKQVNDPNCGTLPDFGNFCITRNADFSCKEEYDRYKGTEELMPYAKGISAKTHDFDEEGNEIHTDFMKMMKIIKDAGYTGYVDIEYEGRTLSEPDGIRATKALLEKVGKALG
jgi:sugar phosphate isomerase/epimerase